MSSELLSPGATAADTAATTATPTAPRACANCGAVVATEFCGYCGQRAEPRLLSMRELVADIVEDQLSVNGTLARSVVPLLVLPGFLTREYLDGRIVRYIPPFRLFFVALAAFLLAVGFELQREQPVIEQVVRKQILVARAREAEKARLGQPTEPVRILSLPVDTARLPAWARAPLRPVARRYDEINRMDPGRAVTLVAGVYLRSASRLMILLVPAVAGLLYLIYRRRRRLYAEHFVFTLHLHAFGFLVLAAKALLPSWLPLDIAVNLWLVAYLLLAMKRVYGDGWGGTTWRFAVFICLYGLLLAVASPVVNAVLVM